MGRYICATNMAQAVHGYVESSGAVWEDKYGLLTNMALCVWLRTAFPEQLVGKNACLSGFEVWGLRV